MNTNDLFERWLKIRQAFDYCIKCKKAGIFNVTVISKRMIITSFLPITYLSERLKRIDNILAELAMEIDITEVHSLLK